MTTEHELLQLARSVVEQAKPGEQIDAYVSRSRDTEIRIYEGDIEQLQSAQSSGVGIRVIKDGRTGFAYVGNLDRKSVAETLAEARDNVQFGTSDEWAGVATPDGVPVIKQDLWSAELEAMSTDEKVRLAFELEKLTLAGDPRIRVEASEYADSFSEGAVATSTGIALYGRESGCYLSVGTLADDNGETQTGYGYSVGRTPSALDPAKAAKDGVERATRLLGASKPASRRTTVILDPMVTASFLSIVGSTLNGESVLKGRSLFANRLGELVAPTSFTMVDDPTNPLAYTASEVDGEGLATRRNLLIENGMLRTFVQSSYSGRRNGTASTGNATRGGFKGTPGCGCLAISVNPGSKSQEELIAGVSDGVLIMQVQGLHSGVNTVSGDFSTGASGVSIVNGQLGAPVREFTIASTLQRMLLDIVEIGNDLDWLPGRAAGLSLVIEGVSVSGS
jgi:PmbA protein